jgi:hypothetical protein
MASIHKNVMYFIAVFLFAIFMTSVLCLNIPGILR